MKTRQDWDAYIADELARFKPLLPSLGFALDERQPHLGGERYLMQAVTTVAGPKLTLLGTRVSDGKRVVIKVTSDPAGAREIEHEARCRAALLEISFAYRCFYAPEEVLHTRTGGLTISVQEFIAQQSSFLDRPLAEQFHLALEGFKIQEGAHATTYGHLKRISKTFPLWGSKEYLWAAEHMSTDQRALVALRRGGERIEQYCGFLTHSDFVPHNIRIRDEKLYLLDYSSLRFGNKYDGWARFVNFMVLYNPPLADALVVYVRDNRTPEESEVLLLMRVYRLVEILAYYRGTLSRTEGSLHTLNSARIEFWSNVLESLLSGVPLSERVRAAYIKTRDALRSPDEKERQVGLH